MGAAQTQGVTIDIPLQHPHLRNCKALTKNKIIFLSATSVTQKPQYQKWKEQLLEFQRHNSESDTDNEWLMLPFMHKFQEGGICSTTGELKLQYEYYPKLLSTQISQRTIQKRKFNQPQLWYLLYALVTARQILFLNGYQLGDLQPRNVFLNSNQQVKVGCLLSWPGEVSAYRKVVLQQDFGYLAPQDIDRLELGAMDNKSNTSSQIFAVGLTMLSASSLQQMKDLYRLKQRDMDEQLFATRVSVFQQDRIYSDIYRAVISNLVQVDVAKRMNQEQLFQFLNKHKQNLINKKPLMFDNVNKKLQESINQLLRLVPPLPRVPHMQQPPTQGRLKLQHSPLHRDLTLQSRELAQKNLKQQVGRSLQKRNNAVPNDLNGAVPHIGANRGINPVLSPRNKALPVNHHHLQLKESANTHYQQYPVPLPNSPKSIYPIQQETIRKPLITHQFQNRSQQTSAQKYKPFETLNNKQPIIQKINQVPQKQVINMKVEQPDTPSSKNSKINELVSDSEEKSSMGGEVNLLMQTRRGFNIVEGVEVKPKEKAGDSRVSETPKLEEHSILKNCKESELIIQKKPSIAEKNQPPSTPQKQVEDLHVANQKQEIVQSPRFKEPSLIVQEQEVKVQNEIKKQAQRKESIESIPLQSVEKIAVVHVQPQIKLQSKKPQIPLDSRFTPSIKVWGMQKGQLTVQEVSKSPLASSQSQKKEEHKDKINIIQQTKERTFSEKSVKSIANEICQKQTLESQKSIKSQQSQQIVKPERKEQQNYILIQQPSIQTDKQEKQPSQKSVEVQNKPETIHAASQAQSIKSISVEQARKRFMYVDIVTESSFQECWSQLQNMIESPTLYSTKVNPDKVIPRKTEYGHFLKVGPGRVKIDFNKQNGKIWLQNIYGSKCQGQIFCGVLKGKDMYHYIWFNSSYTYRGIHFPSREIFDEALLIAKNNLKKKTDSN